jgi:hypothetical protein
LCPYTTEPTDWNTIVIPMAANIVCHSDSLRVPGEPTFDYGQAKSVGTFTCDSELSGVKCTDNITGHYFRVSRDSYDLG